MDLDKDKLADNLYQEFHEMKDTLKRFGDILKLYSEQFEIMINDNEFKGCQIFMEDYPDRMKQLIENLQKKTQ